MTPEEVRFFNLARYYAEPKHSYHLETIFFNTDTSMYHLTFRSSKSDVRVVTVFKDQFDEAVVMNALSSKIMSNIDDALGGWALPW